MQWYTSDEIPDRADLINGRQYIKEPLVGYAQKQPQSPADAIEITKVYVQDSYIVADNVSTSIFSIPLTDKIIWLDAAYDQLNRLNCAYIEAGQLKLYWYDPVVARFVTTLLGPATKCFLFMDDLRVYIPATAFNANYLIYERGSSLYVRTQSDRFLTEELIVNLSEGETVLGAGMNAKYRLQIVLERTSLDDQAYGTESLLHVYAVDDKLITVDGQYITYEA